MPMAFPFPPAPGPGPAQEAPGNEGLVCHSQ
jgi:hypothetical protein